MFAVSDNAPLGACIQQLNSTLETIFGQVRQLVDETRSLWARVLAEGRQPTAKDLATLRPGIDQQLLATGAFGCGGGVILEPGCLADRQMHLEWWYLPMAVKPCLCALTSTSATPSPSPTHKT